jgi:hypothetical protein
MTRTKRHLGHPEEERKKIILKMVVLDLLGDHRWMEKEAFWRRPFRLLGDTLRQGIERTAIEKRCSIYTRRRP